MLKYCDNIFVQMSNVKKPIKIVDAFWGVCWALESESMALHMHRTDGPAFVGNNGRLEWFVDGICYSASESGAGRCYGNLHAWAKKALQFEQIEATEENIANHLQKVLANVVEGQI